MGLVLQVLLILSLKVCKGMFPSKKENYENKVGRGSLRRQLLASSNR